jgi:hypothetical protein
MDTIGNLVVHLEANIARFDSELRRATGIATQTMGKVERATSLATKALGALGIAFGAIEIARFVTGAIRATSALDDLAESTGASVEALSRFERVIAVTGAGSLDMVGAGLAKLAKNISMAGEDSAKSAAAFQALGLDMKAFGNDTGRAMEEVALKLNQYQDGLNKTALAMAIFGRSGAQMLPFLKELAENQEVLGIRTREQAAAAEEMEKKWRRFALAGDEVRTAIVNKLVGPLSDLATAMLLIKKVWDGNFFNFAKGLVGQAGSIMTGNNEQHYIANLTARMQELTRERQQLATQGPMVPRAVREESLAENAREIESVGRLIDYYKQLAANKAMALATPSTLDARDLRLRSPKPEAPALPDAGADKKKKDMEALLPWLDNYYRQIDQYEKQSYDNLVKQHKLEKERLKTLGDEAALEEEMWRNAAAAIAIQEKAREQMLAGMRDETVLAEARLRLTGVEEAQRLKILAVIEASFAINRAALAGDQELVDILQEQLRIKLAQIDADDQQAKTRAQVKEYEKFMTQIGDSLTDALFRAFENGKDFAGAFRDVLVNTFKTMVLKPAIQWVINGALGMGASALGMAVPGLAQAGGLGGLSLGDVGGAASLANLFTGGGLSASFGTFAGNTALALGASGSTALTMAGIGSAIGVAAPWIGAAALLYSIFKKPRGGPKSGGFAQTGLGDIERFFTPSGADADLANLVSGFGSDYARMASAFGGKAGDYGFGLGFDTDPQGTAPNRLSAELRMGGQSLLSIRDMDLGRDEAALQAAISRETKRALLLALQNSELPEAMSRVLNSVAADALTEAQLDAVFQIATAFDAISDSLDAMRDPMQAVDEEMQSLDAQYDDARNALLSLMATVEPTAEGFAQLEGATAEYAAAARQLIGTYRQLQEQVESMFRDTARNIRTSVMTDAQRRSFLESDTAYWQSVAMTTTDPNMLAYANQRINQNVSEAWELVPEAQRTPELAEQWATNVESWDAAFQARMNDLVTKINEENNTLVESLGAKFEEITTKMMQAATKQDAAADTQLTAATRAKVLRIDLTDDARALISTASEVGY